MPNVGGREYTVSRIVDIVFGSIVEVLHGRKKGELGGFGGFPLRRSERHGGRKARHGVRIEQECVVTRGFERTGNETPLRADGAFPLVEKG